MIFDPIHIAAAEELKDQLRDIANVGVNLRNVPLNRLEWDIKHELQDSITEYENDKGADVLPIALKKVCDYLAGPQS